MNLVAPTRQAVIDTASMSAFLAIEIIFGIFIKKMLDRLLIPVVQCSDTITEGAEQ